MKTAEAILNAAIGVLGRRGRCTNNFGWAGKVCVLGGLAVAAGREPDYWLELGAAPQETLPGPDMALVEAARHLAAVVIPPLGDADLDDLIVLIGHWHDGERHPGDVQPKNSEVFAALAAAADRASLSVPAEQIEALA